MKSDLFTGRYLFHFHTTLTDGDLSIRDYFDFARAERIDRLIFLEHIRREATYDVPAFVREVRDTSAREEITAFVGFEAKLLPDGALDILDEHFDAADVIGVAEHGFREGPDRLRGAMGRALQAAASRRPELPVVWVHPGLSFVRSGLEPSDSPDYQAAIREAQEHGAYVERNLKYDLAPRSVLAAVRSDRRVFGIDAHRAEDFSRWEACEAEAQAGRH